jgi:hypothetical protein
MDRLRQPATSTVLYQPTHSRRIYVRCRSREIAAAAAIAIAAMRELERGLAPAD